MENTPTKLSAFSLILLWVVLASINAAHAESACCPSAPKEAPGIQIKYADGQYLFTQCDEKIMVYNRDPISRADGQYKRGHYIHPLYNLDGQVITEDMPKDHPHHRGIFWAWTQLYVGDKRIGHPWEQKDASWDVTDVQQLKGKDYAGLKCDVLWKSPLYADDKGKEKPIVKETAVMKVYQKSGNARIFDFDISLLAMQDDVRLGGSTNAKGYGGFSFRLPQPKDLKAIGPTGPVKQENRKPSAPQPWIDFSGSFTKNAKSGIAILCHPTTPGFPQGWTIRVNSLSCQNPVWPGETPVNLSRAKPVVLRYRIIVHRGDAGAIDIEKHFREYAKSIGG